VIYAAGCEMRVRPSREHVVRAAKAGVRYNSRTLLQDFVHQCNEAGLSSDDLDALTPAEQYHFDEHKPLRAAAATDAHYFRIAQYLRLARRSMALAGLQLISVTPHSRLNDYFPYVSCRRALEQIRRNVGSPGDEPVQGLYRQTTQRQPRLSGPMRDFRPHNWSRQGRPARADHHDPPANPELQNEGELLIEREGMQRVGLPKGATNPAAKLRKELDRMADADFVPPEEG
jgi:hypothetical protein